jgi:hypothetical protein
MPTFRKKPVTVEAWPNYTGDPEIDGRCGLAVPMPVWLNAARPTGQVVPGPNGSLLILTLEGRMLADVGDWIIKGIKGELYPCKPDIFAATYDPVTESHQQRVVTELADLNIKVAALRKFLGSDIYAGLDPAEQSRIDRQLGAMTIYSDILTERVDAFTPKE